MNVTIDGVILDKDGAVDTSIQYQAYFKRNGAGGASGWNIVRTVEAGGYYNVSPEDADWLGVGAIVEAGDQIILAAWKGASSNRNDATHTQFALTYYTLTSAEVYTNQWRIRENQEPTSTISHAATARVLTPLAVTFTGTDAHNGTPVGDDLGWYQAASVLGVTVFSAVVGVDFIDTDWDTDNPGTDTTQWSPNSTTHTWAAFGIKNISTLATDLQGLQASAPYISQVTVLYRLPTATLSLTPPASGTFPTILDTVTLDANVTDPDSIVTQTDIIVDPGTGDEQQFLSQSSVADYQWSTNGTKVVRIVLHYNDGSGATTQNFDTNVIVRNIDPTANFTEASVKSAARITTWTDASSDVDGTIAGYAWTLSRSDGLGGWDVVGSASGAGAVSFSWRFTPDDEGDTYRIGLTVTDDDGGTGTKTVEWVVPTVPPSIRIIPLASD